MTTRERTSQEQVPATRPPSVNESPNPDAARAAGEAYLMAAGRALDQALSTEPERFLQQNRQLGGQ